MEKISERNRLRYTGRIPQETLDYLSAKNRADNRLRWWEVPVLLAVSVYLAVLIALSVRSGELSRHSLILLTLVFLTAGTLFRRIRRLFD